MLGGAIAEVMLAQLNLRKVFGVITTHYTNLKHLASVTPGILNGAMAFDNHLMQPLFQLSIGKPGSSFAFEIARKIGLPEDILQAASEKAGVSNINYDRHLKDIARDKRYWENKRQNIRQQEKKLEDLVEEYEKELSGIKSLRKDVISQAREEAEKMLSDSNRLIENTIRQIKEAQAEREKTREARQELDRLRNDIKELDPEHSGEIRKAKALEEKTRKIRKKAHKKEDVTAEASLPLKSGDAVRMTDTMVVGEIVGIRDDMASVEAGSLLLKVPVSRLERISRSELKKSMRGSSSYRPPDPAVTERKLRFKPEIDLRGVRGEDALISVRDLIDDALMLQHRSLRILHGKGNGILRHLIREYLAGVDVVSSFRDEHIESGGSGITVVELDF